MPMYITSEIFHLILSITINKNREQALESLWNFNHQEQSQIEQTCFNQKKSFYKVARHWKPGSKDLPGQKTAEPTIFASFKVYHKTSKFSSDYLHTNISSQY